MIAKMNVGKRVSSAPVFSSQETRTDIALSCASTIDASEKRRTKLPRSPGFLNHEHSSARLEFQDSKKSMDELREFARTTSPGRPCPQPISRLPSAASLARSDSGRRRRFLEHIAESSNLPSKPFKRLLYRLSRSATNSDLTKDTVSRGSSEVASKRSSGGRKYKKIAFNPKLYGSHNPSTYKVNFQDPEANGANNGYSPTKHIPEPEFGPNLQDDFAATTRAIAQAHARRNRQVPTSPKKRILQSQHHGSPIRNHGNYACRRSASFKGPYSVPIKFQMRPQRVSLPKTPRTSLDEPSTLKETSPLVNGKAKASSTLSGSDSVATDGQSDAESGEIMNAQSAEVIRGHGSLGYHARTSQKPPRSGPAPTRALPSLPEGHDNIAPDSSTAERQAPSASIQQSTSGSSPKQKTSRSPAKGHRYRLSPVKNNIRKDTPVPMELQPSPKFTEEFPKPPHSSPITASPRRDREVDIGEVVACLRNQTPGLSTGVATYGSGGHQETVNGTQTPPGMPTFAQSQNQETSNQNYTDYDKDHLYLPWQGCRVERVKALKARDIERVRPKQENVVKQKHIENSTVISSNENAREEGAFTSEDSHIPKSQSSPVFATRSPRCSNQTNPGHGKNIPSNNPQMDFSPVITIAEQAPFPANQLDPPPSYLDPVDHQSLPHAFSNPPPAIYGHPSDSSSARAGRLDPSSHSRPLSHPSTSDLEARIASLERKNLLLERAFMAVIDTSSGFASLAKMRGGCERRESWNVEGEDDEERERRRASAASEVLAPLVGRVEGMLMALQGVGRGRIG